MNTNEAKLLIILDLDETLIFATEENLEFIPDFKVDKYNIFKRPFLDKFLNELYKEFSIAIWSSASDEYVHNVVEKIIPPEIKLEFVWGRSKCVYKRNTQIDEYGNYDYNYRNHYHYIKPLKKVKKKGYEMEKILIIDDSPHKSKENYGNAIYPKEFNGDPNDNELQLLAKYLERFKNIQNVRTIEKRRWRLQVEQE